MYTLQSALSLYENRDLFEEIHQAKSAFLTLLENISNKIDSQKLIETHPTSKGIKISKGNELAHCPYQVLDVIRDFDPITGLNIRLLHWWGYGMYVFVLVGENYFDRKDGDAVLNNECLPGFVVSAISAHFSYLEIIEDFELKTRSSKYSRQDDFQIGRIQFVKKIPYGVSFDATEQVLLEEIRSLVQFFRNR